MSLFMAASVNNIAATFATVPKTSSPSSSSSSSNPHQTKFSLSLSHKSISTSWNLHKTLPRSQRSSLLNLYGPPGPPPNGSISIVHPRPLMIPPKRSKPLSVCIGVKLPNITLSYLDPNDGAKLISLSTLCKGKRVVLVGVSAPFSPRCTRFVKRVASARGKSSDLIACVAASDVFVMRAWGENLAVGDRVMMLSDGRGELGNALGVSLNLNTATNACLVTFNGVIKSVEFDKEEGSLVAIKSLAH
ncbi:PREDICTED: peroxiredoxin-2E-1, chloroplastic-like [Prunus mume]|uniref:glutaredoxin-dependent peroxiredoxin n=1 Tax=Prunus mume TaxID=102107 RepID=A0ABM0N7X2_PRUMU|nr:PREDICTED: peroxiredoxin-2E-1, chloroplastic-like [Prunus mume]